MNFCVLGETSSLTGWALLWNESIKAIPNALIAAVGALTALIIGRRVTALWASRQKRREIELTTLEQFYHIYGDFFALWKQWNRLFTDDGKLKDPRVPRDLYFELASKVDAGIESILVKISSERVLNKDEIDELGLLRQGFQTLRNVIKYDENLDWPSSGHPEYVAFKSAACFLSTMLISHDTYECPNAIKAAGQLKEITSNRHEGRWLAICG